MKTMKTPDVAIIGMASLFPNSKDIHQYWHNIMSRKSAIQTASPEWIQGCYDPNSKENNRIKSALGGFLGELARFDPLEFGVMPKSIDGAEPDHFLALQIAQEALRDADYIERGFDRVGTGIILGRGTYINRGYNTLLQHGQIIDQTIEILRSIHPNLSEGTVLRIKQDLKSGLPAFNAEMAPGLVPNVITGRIANRLDLMGPNYIVDAACASSLIAVEHALRELATGTCNMMLAGGVHASTPPQINMIFEQLGALGKYKIAPFGEDAQGTILSEGIGIVVLKRLNDAIKDKDRIYAVIKGFGCASDGKALGLLAPREEGEVLALKRAYDSCNIDPQSIDLIEAHGTGIKLGDVTEISSLISVVGDQSYNSLPTCAVGSVKSMIGHTIPAAGAASLIKVALSLYHKVLPPMLCDEVNKDLRLDYSRLYINTQARPWVKSNSKPRRAGINSFGFGGINAHLILEEFISNQGESESNLSPLDFWSHELCLFSAESDEYLKGEIKSWLDRINSDVDLSVSEVAYELALHTKGKSRIALVVENRKELINALESLEREMTSGGVIQTGRTCFSSKANLKKPGKVCLLFPGEGSQYRDMLRELCIYFPSIRRWFDLLDSTFSERTVLPSQAIFSTPNGIDEQGVQLLKGELNGMNLGSESIFISSLAIFSLLLELGIEFDLMVGHSTGENTSIVASNMVSCGNLGEVGEQMHKLNKIFSEIQDAERIPEGVLLAVAAIGIEAIEECLNSFTDQAYIAMDNCAHQVIVYCDKSVALDLEQKLKRRSGIISRLPFNRAYHTPLFREVSQAFEKYYQDSIDTKRLYEVFSCTSLDYIPHDVQSACTVLSDQWSSRVRFREAIEYLYSQGYSTFIEVGPSSNLTSFVKDILRGKEFKALPSNKKRESGLKVFLQLVAALSVSQDLDLRPLFERRIFKNYVSSDKFRTKTEVVLDLTMPRMTLSAEMADVINREISMLSSEFNNIHSEVLSEMPNNDMFNDVEDSFSICSDLNTFTFGANQAVQAETYSDTQEVERDLLGAHFMLMNQFLEQQQRLFGKICQSTLIQNSNYSKFNFSPSFRHRKCSFHLLGDIISLGNGKLEAEKVFSLTSDLFLLDHTLGGKPSHHTDDIHPLPVVPFTISMEMVAEAGLLLAGNDMKVTEIRNARGYKWIALDEGEVVLRITGQERHSLNGECIIDVRISQVDANTPVNILMFEGCACLSRKYMDRSDALVSPLDDLFPSRWSDSELYTTGMFHGALFQGVEHIVGWNTQGIEAYLRCIPTSNFFAHNIDEKFLIEPGLLDAAGQLVGYWVSEQFGTDFNVFPFMVDSYIQYIDSCDYPEKIYCRARIRFVNELQTSGSFEFLTEHGLVIAKLEGWQDRYFDIPNNYYQCRLDPVNALLSSQLVLPKCLESRMISQFPKNFFVDGWAIWLKVLAHLVLNKNERRMWYKLTDKGRRREEWLLGRICAKDCVRLWVQRQFNVRLSPVDIEIYNLASGQPNFMLPDFVNHEFEQPILSITHSDGNALAVLSETTDSVGIDLQSRETGSEKISQVIYNPQEVTILSGFSDWHIVGWVAKESASKSLGTGLEYDPKAWIIYNANPHTLQLTIYHVKRRIYFCASIVYFPEYIVGFAWPVGVSRGESDL